MLLDRGIVVSYETVRRWCRKHGPDYARRIRQKAPTKDDVWYLDEVVVRVNGQKCWLWRAVDQDGYVLDEIVQPRRNTKAAKRQVMPNVEHRSHKGLNNRAENSHLPFRKRERTRQGFRSVGSLQHFVSIFSAVRNLFVPSQANRSAAQIRTHRRQAMAARKAVSARPA